MQQATDYIGQHEIIASGVVLKPEEISELMSHTPSENQADKAAYGSGFALSYHIGDLVQVLSGAFGGLLYPLRYLVNL